MQRAGQRHAEGKEGGKDVELKSFPSEEKSHNSDNVTFILHGISYFVWPLIIFLPLVLTFNDAYTSIFPRAWYDTIAVDVWRSKSWPSPLGLSLGLLAVVVGQFFMLGYFILRRHDRLGGLLAIQKDGARFIELYTLLLFNHSLIRF